MGGGEEGRCGRGVAIPRATSVATRAVRMKTREPKPTIWEKMTKGLEEMPEDFPPRIMFDNLEATKANTAKIHALIETEKRQTDDVEAMAMA